MLRVQYFYLVSFCGGNLGGWKGMFLQDIKSKVFQFFKSNKKGPIPHTLFHAELRTTLSIFSFLSPWKKTINNVWKQVLVRASPMASSSNFSYFHGMNRKRFKWRSQEKIFWQKLPAGIVITIIWGLQSSTGRIRSNDFRYNIVNWSNQCVLCLIS